MGILIVLLILLFIHIHESGHHKEARGTATRGCDLSQGSWIADESYPLYSSSDCPFILNEFDCIRNGRPDKNYVKYRWQPKNCNLPRYTSFICYYSVSFSQHGTITLIHSMSITVTLKLLNILLQSGLKFILLINSNTYFKCNLLLCNFNEVKLQFCS